jgi:hypothetical protein
LSLIVAEFHTVAVAEANLEIGMPNWIPLT